MRSQLEPPRSPRLRGGFFRRRWRRMDPAACGVRAGGGRRYPGCRATAVLPPQRRGYLRGAQPAARCCVAVSARTLCGAGARIPARAAVHERRPALGGQEFPDWLAQRTPAGTTAGSPTCETEWTCEDVAVTWSNRPGPASTRGFATVAPEVTRRAAPNCSRACACFESAYPGRSVWKHKPARRPRRSIHRAGRRSVTQDRRGTLCCIPCRHRGCVSSSARPRMHAGRVRRTGPRRRTRRYARLAVRGRPGHGDWNAAGAGGRTGGTHEHVRTTGRTSTPRNAHRSLAVPAAAARIAAVGTVAVLQGRAGEGR